MVRRGSGVRVPSPAPSGPSDRSSLHSRAHAAKAKRTQPRWGAFYRTTLEDRLRAVDVGTNVICGCKFPNWPRTTIYEASERDFQIVFVPDATSGAMSAG
jgi:nicotinamidase-related amidase